ncbi:MAG: RsmE family RNA methyltransferase, partial [Fimbriimonadales bacterium]|nr:RsmE family RNA methyltransferase [Fimbriimonadales bacterium]
MGRRRVSQVLTPRALPRFFVPKDALKERALPDEVVHHARRVLRLHAGDWVCLLNGEGGVYLAQLGKEPHQLQQLVPSALETELPFEVSILQSLVPADKAEVVVRLCVQGGAHAIHFAPSARSIVRWEPEKQARYAARWQKIAQEEAALACRARLTRVHLWDNWQQAFTQLPRPVLVLDEWEGTLPLKQRCRRMPMPETLSIVVGPEGG